MKRITVFLFICLLSCAADESNVQVNPSSSNGTVNALSLGFPPPPASFVLDQVDIIPVQYEDSINILCTALEDATSAEMAVLTISSFDGAEPGVYASELGNYWGVGHKEENNGVVMVVAIDDREVFTATGLGTQLILSDSVVYSIYEDILVPNFRQKDYGPGIYEAMQQYARIIQEFYTEHPEGILKFFDVKFPPADDSVKYE